jgi:uncharacterized protein
MNPHPYRLHVVDALRGFTIASIMLLHNIEHFDFYYTPKNLPDWIILLDKGIWKSLFFMFGGKSYAIFALLFGLTFFIQSNNQEKKGKDFRGRFAWRLVLLFLFGFINSAFYEGDILIIYALIGFLMLPVAKMNSRTVFWIAVILMFQPFYWFMFFKSFQNPGMEMANPLSWSYFGKMGEYITGNSLLKLWIGNLTDGKTAVFIWTWETGRVFQTLSLFMFGMLAGRKYLFEKSDENKKVWTKILVVASILFVPLFIFKTGLDSWIKSEAIRRPLGTIISSWSNMAFMLVLLSGFVLLFWSIALHKVLNVFSPMGKMSLSNYIMQSVMGSLIYYEIGLGMYQYTGATYSFLIGIVLAIIQGYFSSWWMRHHVRGPLETIWHKATWVGLR